MTLSSYIAQTRERALNQWFEKLPDHEAERCADWYFEAVNKLRRVRFNTPIFCCDDCGIGFPPDDLTQVRKSDGRPYLLCVSCLEFGEFVRAILGWGNEAA